MTLRNGITRYEEHHDPRYNKRKSSFLGDPFDF